MCVFAHPEFEGFCSIFVLFIRCLVLGDVLGMCGSVPGVAAMCASLLAVELTFSWCHCRSTLRLY